MTYRLRESHAEDLINEHLRDRGWDLVDFSSVERQFVLPSGRKVDYVFKLDGQIAAVLEVKRPSLDLYAALAQARQYANEIRAAGLGDAHLLFAADGYNWLRQNLAARTLPERLLEFPTPNEFRAYFQPQTREFLGTLRDYQRVAISQVYGAVKNNRTKMYLHMATGTGKTVVAAAAIAKSFTEGLARRFLFLVDRDSLADQTVRSFVHFLGDAFKVKRMTGASDERYADILVSTVQFLAVGEKFRRWPNNHFDMVFLDECHRSYFGDWHPVLEYFYEGGARLIGMTATPSDKETQNTDLYFTDPGQPSGPIYRYTIRQGEQDGILARCVHFKFLTNVDLAGVHDMGFDFDPKDLGRAVDVPQRNELIAEKYFTDVIGSRKPLKTIVFAASIAHANNLRYALIRKFNELNHLPPNDASAEAFIVPIHNQVPGAAELIQEFRKPLPAEERARVIERALNGGLTVPQPVIAVSVEMMSTGVDAPDVECLVMARPTESKVLYVQMKGRGTRKCEETGKEFYKLIDFVDLARIEEVVTNETPGVEDEPEDWLPALPPEVPEVEAEEEAPERVGPPRQRQEMVIADVPVWIEVAEVIAPETLQELRQQIEAQLARVREREALIERFKQAVLAWRYFRRDEPLDPVYLSTMGYDLSVLRDLFGEVDATLEDFVAVAEGHTTFDFLRERQRLWEFAQLNGLSPTQREFLEMLWDFKRANPNLSVTQLLRSQWLQSKGGVVALERAFGSLETYFDLYQEAMDALGEAGSQGEGT